MAAQHHSLDRLLMRGLAWTGGVRWLTQALSWGITIVVARTLTPADYGLMGMATVYVGFAQLLSDAGLSAAVINRREADPEVWTRLGGLAVLLGACCCGISLAGADLIARFYGRPEVATVIRVLSVLFIARGLQMLPRGLLARELDFRRLAWIEGIEAVVLSAVTLSFALAGAGYWALVSGVVASGLTGTILSCHWRSHPIRWPNDLRRMRGDLAIGFHILGSQLAWYTYSNSDFAVVGRVLGSGALGAYSLAWTIASVPVERVSALVGRVTPAFFATVQRDSEALRRYLHRLTEGISLLTVPASIGLALVAPTFVAVLLGPRWVGVVAPLRFLALYAAFRSVATLAPQVLVAAGRARENMNFSILAALILPGVFYVGARWGTTGVALGWMVAYPLLASLLFRTVFQTIRMPVARYLDALQPALVATALMTVAVLGVQLLVPGAPYPLLSLIAQVVVGALVCIATVIIWYPDRVAAFRHALHLSGLWRYSVPVPLFATAERPERPRLLLISPHFPPDQATGALRWQKFSRFAVERGWGLDVIALHPDDLPAPDPRRLADLPAGVRIYGVRAPTLWTDRVEQGVAALLRRVRRVGHPAGPGADARGPAAVDSLGRSEGERWRIRGVRDLARAYFAWNTHLHDGLWARAAAGVAHRVIDLDLHRAVISCGPPHNAHEAGRLVAAGTDLPFVMDLRDPWSQVQRLPEAIASPVWWAFARRDERRAVARASLIVGNSEPLRDALRAAYPAAAERIVAVTNGFDDDPLPATRPGGRFTIAYAGAIYLDRDPRPLFRAVAQVVRDSGVGPDGLAIELMGSVDSFEGRSLEMIAEEEGVRPYLHLRPLAPRSQALEFLSRAHMLVILPQDSDLAIPAKVFDYVRYPAWILALVGAGSATGRLLRGTGADVVAPDDPDAIAAVIGARLRQHQEGDRPGPLVGLARFARSTQATVLFDAIERVTGPLPRETATLVGARTMVEVPA